MAQDVKRAISGHSTVDSVGPTEPPALDGTQPTSKCATDRAFAVV